MAPSLDLIGIVVADMAKSLAFYRRLGLQAPAFPGVRDEWFGATTPARVALVVDDEGMAWLRRWLAVLAAAIMAGLLLPGAAWASRSPGVLALVDEAARRRRGWGGVGLLGTFCCLGVVALVILAVLLIARGRRSGGGPR